MTRTTYVADIGVKTAFAILLGLIVVVVFGWHTVTAMTTGFETMDMDSEDQKRYIAAVEFAPLDSGVNGEPFICFDMSNDGLAALGFSEGNPDMICVYNADGEFLYGYSFNSPGSYTIEWDGDNLLVYFIRSQIAALFDRSANCLDMRRILDTSDNDAYWNKVKYSKKRIVGSNEYQISNGFGLMDFVTTGYSRLVMTDEDGEETTIYDASGSYRTRVILSVVGIALFTIGVSLGIGREIYKLNYAKTPK